MLASLTLGAPELGIPVDGSVRTPADPCRFVNRCGRGDANLWIAYAGEWMSIAAKRVGQNRQRIVAVERMATQYAQLLRSDTCTYLSADCTPLVRTAISLAELAAEYAATWAHEDGVGLEAPTGRGWVQPPASLPIPAETRDKLRELDALWLAWLESIKKKVQDKVGESIPWIVLAILAFAALHSARGGERW